MVTSNRFDVGQHRTRGNWPARVLCVRSLRKSWVLVGVVYCDKTGVEFMFVWRLDGSALGIMGEVMKGNTFTKQSAFDLVQKEQTQAPTPNLVENIIHLFGKNNKGG
jgi:hypothetical protein